MLVLLEILACYLPFLCNCLWNVAISELIFVFVCVCVCVCVGRLEKDMNWTSWKT